MNDILDIKLKGIGHTKAVTIVAALELGRRRKLSEAKSEIEQIKSSNDIFRLVETQLNDLHHEEFHLLLLNRANKILEHKIISSGGITGTVADIRLIFEHALKTKAVSIILVHNHPSGNLKPSEADIQLTKKIIASGNMLDIKVLDHIIVAGKNYFSFADEGMM